MKQLFYKLAGIIVLVIACLALYDLSYSPLHRVNTDKLFKEICNLKKICSVDFLGFNARGEFYEIYKYSVGRVEIDSSFPVLKSWENRELPEGAIVKKWQACPLDESSYQLYEFIFTVNNLDEKECSSKFNEALKGSQNYYSYIHINESEQYFLLYSSKEESLYYLRRKGF